MKKYLEKVIREKEAEVRALREKNDKATGEKELRAIGETLAKLGEEIAEAKAELEKMEQQEEDPGEQMQTDPGEEVLEGRAKNFRAVATYYDTTAKEKRETVGGLNMEQRGRELKEKRAITVPSGILLPKHFSDEITQPFEQVSSLVDNLKAVSLPNGDAYDKAFVKDVPTGGITQEGAVSTTAEPEFDYVRMNKVKITAYAEVSEEVEDLANADYAGEILKDMGVALRKKIAEQVLNGTGTNQFLGIFSTSEENKAIDANKDLEVAAITETTLDDIIFSYGGDEEVEGAAALILNKADLKAFAKLRDGNGNRVHEIDYGNRTIDGIRYYINSNCAALSNSETAASSFCMAFGDPMNYELPNFSDVTIKRGDEVKFKEGQIAYRAKGYFGGGTVKWNGFLRVKKATSV